MELVKQRLNALFSTSDLLSDEDDTEESDNTNGPIDELLKNYMDVSEHRIW